jgi:integrase
MFKDAVKAKRIEAVLAACPNPEWRVIVALGRYGGLRCPSETLALKWADIDWEKQRVRVPSPKTAHLRGKGERFIPLFKELAPHLEAAFDAAPEGDAVFPSFDEAMAWCRANGWDDADEREILDLVAPDVADARLACQLYARGALALSVP